MDGQNKDGWMAAHKQRTKIIYISCLYVNVKSTFQKSQTYLWYE